MEGRCKEVSLVKSGPKSMFGKYSDAEMVAQLKGLALDPGNSEFSQTNIRPLWNQAIRVRKVMALAEVDFPRRKRKLLQMLKDLPGFGLPLLNQQPGTKLSRGQVSHASSASCLLNSTESTESFGIKIALDSHSSNSILTFEDNVSQKQRYTEIPFVDGTMNLSPGKDDSPIVDSDESANCLNTSSPENVTLQEVPSLNVDAISHPSCSPVQNPPARNHHLQSRRQSNRLLNFIGDNPQRMVVPVGPRFQAEIPEWSGPQNDEDSESSKWLGTRIWPMDGGGRRGSATRVAGKGRSESCSCSSPVSVECVQRHIIEERLLLLCDLGGAFFRMKLNEAGEQIAKSWPSEEQEKFGLLARKNRLSNGKDFLKHASKCFPNKSRKSIMSYYFNVFIPRRMSEETRASRQIDTDDEEEEKVDCSDSKQKSGGRKAICSSKEVKDRFLRRP